MTGGVTPMYHSYRLFVNRETCRAVLYDQHIHDMIRVITSAMRLGSIYF